MIELEITNANLFDSLLTINYGKESFFDLHNDYILLSIEYEQQGNLVLHFLSNNKKETLRLLFEKVVFITFTIPTNERGLSLDNFHRGRYECENKLYDSYENKNCFYIEFCENGDITILSSRVTLVKKIEGKVIKLE